MQYTNREKVVLATFQFTKDARAWWKATSAHLPNVADLEWAGFLEIFRGKYFSERVKEKKAVKFAALKQKGMTVAEYEAQFTRLAVYAPHLVGTERLKANRFMDGLRPMFIERLGPHNIQTYTEMVQRAQLVEDTMAKVECMRGKDISKPTFIKRGAVDTIGTFPNNNTNNYNNNKRPTTGKDYGMEKKIKVEETKMVEYCNFCNKLGHRAEECWKKAGACLRCGSRDHRLSNCPMLKDQVARNQGVDTTTYEYTSMKSLSESKSEGFWGVLARKAKSILDDDNAMQQQKTPRQYQHQPQTLNAPTSAQIHQSYQSPESQRRADNPAIQKRLGALTSSLNYIGGTIGNALEEGLTMVENRTADIIQETKKLNIRRKSSGPNVQNIGANPLGVHQMQTDQETQLKASRDVANAMAAKAKLLLRELKTVKADLAFAKERCAQLEEENKVLRESREKGDHPEDDDLIRLQLETLLAEKARLAHENSIYARENRFLREIVEYHQLTMQDVVYLDEGIEEVTEVYQNQMPIVSSRAAGESQISVPASPGLSQDPTALPVPMPPPFLHTLPSFELEDCPDDPTLASSAISDVVDHSPKVKAGKDLKRQTSSNSV
ncbi:hypothetical protein Taro_033839 [Colocasia esculenta]|uniref:CCHC-type domain-containing protein n=1 Tax=Colocasia esculenta TaxID=4460 RepID=A0A843W2I8_COLES|nr:hypothetical protein [Colocasia esculenta]